MNKHHLLCGKSWITGSKPELQLPLSPPPSRKNNNAWSMIRGLLSLFSLQNLVFGLQISR